MGLREYHRKRDFAKTPEPRGREHGAAGELSFTIQKHAATRLHYDFRLEMEGVLRSWAVPKGPSLDTKDKRLAVHVEDHPLEYGDFEGIIPKGQYGGGTVLLWDRGRWIPNGDPVAGYRAGKLKFRLEGEKLRGSWTLFRMGGRRGAGDSDDDNWLLAKHADAEARRGRAGDITALRPESVASGRAIDEIAQDADRVWSSGASEKPKAAGKKTKAAGKKRALTLPDAARKGPVPDRLAPELATLVTAVPAGEDWIHEIKFDGYRALCFIEGGKARLVSRNGKDWTRAFAPLARAAVRLPVRSAVLDGEVVVHAKDGVTSFQALQQALGEERSDELYYYVFDLPYVDGHDLSAVPLEERKQVLARVLGTARNPLRYADHVAGSGDAFYGQACRHALEGVVSKRRDSPYRSGRGRDWLKIRCGKRQEFVIGGFTEPSGARKGLGALLLGVNDPARGLVFAGKVGTGFTQHTLRTLRKRLGAIERDETPFANPPRERGVHWVEPTLVGEVEFTEWTREGKVRHPSFEGLREDKAAADVVRELPAATQDVAKKPASSGRKPARGAKAEPAARAAPAAKSAARTSPAAKSVRGGAGTAEIAGVRLTHPDRVLYPDPGLTKLDLARYYESVAERMLPHVAGRPLMLVRCPEGAGGECFHQKHASAGLDESVRRATVGEGEGRADVLHVEDTAGLIALVQVGALEVHVWGSRVRNVEKPDLLVFDLDPDPGIGWDRVIDGAHDVRDRLAEIGLESFVKTSGGKGLHVCVPLVPRVPWDQAKAFTRALVEDVSRAHPDRYTTTASKARRKGRIFLDYLRNGRGATAVAAFSTRARDGAPVSAPVRWDELTKTLRPDAFTAVDNPARLASLRADPWKGFFDVKQSITAAMRRDVGA